MTKFIAVESIRDLSLSPTILKDVGSIIQAENTTRKVGLKQYAYIDNGIVTACVALVIKHGTASAIWFHGTSLSDIENIIRTDFPEVRYINVYSKQIQDPSDGWQTVATNFKSRILTPTKEYTFEDTDNPAVKRCTVSTGTVICAVTPEVVSIMLMNEQINRELQKTVDLLAGVAVDMGLTFVVQAATTAWSASLFANPNYVFNNCMVAKDLQA